MLAPRAQRLAWVCVFALALTTASALASIDLEWRPLSQTVNVGDPVEIGLYALSDLGVNQDFNSLQVIMSWNPSYLTLTGDDHSTGVGLASSSFMAGDSWGFNESNPPADGDGIWFGYAQIGHTLPATPAGSLLTVITFTAAAETPGTLVDLWALGQKPARPQAYSAVMSGTQNVIGGLGGPANITIVPEPASLTFLALALSALATRRH